MVQAERGPREISRSGARSRKHSYGSEREWKKPPAYFLLLFLHLLMHQPPGNSAVRVAKAERGQQKETTGIKTLREGDIPLHLVKLQGQKGRSNTVAFMFSLSLSPPATWPWRQNSHRSGWFLTGGMKRSYRKLESTRRGMMLRNATP